jgi:hypothetical protein
MFIFLTISAHGSHQGRECTITKPCLSELSVMFSPSPVCIFVSMSW